MTHPYFIDQARDVFVRAGGDPDLSGPLAQWAETARQVNDPRVGVVVAQDGTILAETRYVRGLETGATYITSVTRPEDTDVVNHEASGSLYLLAKRYGQQCIRVKFSEVCQGAGRYTGPRS